MKLKLFFSFLLLSTFIYFSLLSPVVAARPRSRKPKNSVTTSNTFSQGIKTQVRFRPDRLGLQLSFSNFSDVQSARYELLYESNGITQGAGGSILLNDTDSKEILFATCSSGVCRFHENITNARLSIVSTLKNGTTILKPFRIKV